MALTHWSRSLACSNIYVWPEVCHDAARVGHVEVCSKARVHACNAAASNLLEPNAHAVQAAACCLNGVFS